VFTGLVADKGVVARWRRRAGGRDAARRRAEPGDSIAVNGVCLTAVERDNGSFAPT
jgi:riboflavin synthase alpha subunit